MSLIEPEGIGFFNVKSGETHYCKLEPTIAAYINSSDMGINASRGQDFGWRLQPKWVKKVREFRANEEKMDTLAAKLRLEDGVMPNTMQILYYIYGREVRSYLQRLEDTDSPFEDQYREDISDKPQQGQAAPIVTSPAPLPIPEGEGDIPNQVADEDLEPGETPVQALPEEGAEDASPRETTGSPEGATPSSETQSSADPRDQ